MTPSGLLETMALVSLVLALAPLLLGLLNLSLYCPIRTAPPSSAPPVSVLIPARNEAANIGPAVTAALANSGIDLEVIVLDDHSIDGTAALAIAAAGGNPRLRVAAAPPLPEGWSGKAHACQKLAELARHPLLLFVDADVRLMPNAIARIAGLIATRRIGLISGFPRQQTMTLGEALVVPLIHFVLIGYLPIAAMRLCRWPALAAGCGQLVATEREAYFAAGGHAGICSSLHDGLTLPRAFRRAGIMTDLFDATDLAQCRMYHGWAETWRGFGKNAHEGMATPIALPVWSMLLGGGHVLPWLLLIWAAAFTSSLAAMITAGSAVLAGLGFRLVLAWRFRQSICSAFVHPLGVTLLLGIQWSALRQRRSGRSALWRGRTYL
jgi:hypothetical protein